MQELNLRVRAELRTLLGDLRIIAASVNHAGHALLLAVSPRDESKALGRSEISFVNNRVEPGYSATLFCLSENFQQRWELDAVAVAHPYVQKLPYGELLVAGARCYYCRGDPEHNAQIFGPDGQLLRTFTLGDGIEDIQVDPRGRIWVSYFDEGVVGNYGWKDPIGRPGLVCFSALGEQLWSFENVGAMVDCYALNVARDGVWVCYYSDFPLVRVDWGHKATVWVNDVRGARALAVTSENVLLWGGYAPDTGRCVIRKLGRQLGTPQQCRCLMPEGVLSVTGRDSTLHVFTQDNWHAFDLRDI